MIRHIHPNSFITDKMDIRDMFIDSAIHAFICNINFLGFGKGLDLNISVSALYDSDSCQVADRGRSFITIIGIT